MPDFNVRSDSVNVEQIMEQIRARIREKRGVDYTEQQIRELAAVKLEKFLDPRGVRSDLLDQFRKAQPAYEPPELPNFAFEDATLFESHRAPIRWIRKLLMPLLKLLFNPNPLIQALHIQSRLNTINAERDARQEAARRQMDQLYYELVHNLVVETTRTGIEVKNLKMRVESISSRLEFNERRARALEGAVVYKTAEAEEPAPRPAPQAAAAAAAAAAAPAAAAIHAAAAAVAPAQPPPAPQARTRRPRLANSRARTWTAAGPGQGQGVPGEGPGQRSRRRRRRRGRRGGGAASAVMGAPGSAVTGRDARRAGVGRRRRPDGRAGSRWTTTDRRSRRRRTTRRSSGSSRPRSRSRPREPNRTSPTQPLEQARPITSPVEQPRSRAVASSRTPTAAPAAPAEPAPVPPPAPDHADHDPQ